MDIELSTPALLFPAIAILMLGYINRYLGTAKVIRTFKKDYDSGYIHTDITKQLTILRKRINMSRHMLTSGVVALICASLSMLFIFLNLKQAGSIAFALSLLALIASMLLSLYETSRSNQSLEIEIQNIFDQENKSR